jgi:hypothetical protein
MAILRWLFRIVLLLVLAAAAFALAARVHDGPFGPLPGGKLVGGTLVAEPVADWTFAAPVQEIELQLESQTISRTTWILVDHGKAYVPASTVMPPGKTWHKLALQDGRALLRISGKRYPVTLAKVDDPAEQAALRDVAKAKYPPPPGTAGGDVWFFAVTSRAGGA